MVTVTVSKLILSGALEGLTVSDTFNQDKCSPIPVVGQRGTMTGTRTRYKVAGVSVTPV